jgi:hypothetical protein
VIDLNAVGNEGDPASQWKNEVNPSTSLVGQWTTPVLTTGTASGSPVTFYRNPDGPGGGFKNIGVGGQPSNPSPISVTGFSNWTFEMWLRRTYVVNSASNGEIHIARMGQESGGSGDPWFALDNGNDFGGGCMGCDNTKLDYFLVGPGGFDGFPDVLDGVLPVVDANDGAFTHLLFTYDNSSTTLNVYQDGAQVGNHALTSFNNWSSSAIIDDLDVFLNDIPARSFPGDISLVRLHDEVLDSNAIAAAYGLGPNAGVPEPGTLALLGLGGLLVAMFRRKS